MDSYLMMLYVTLEQESALKKFFVDQGWTFCKPDLAVTTDKVGPSILPPAVQKSGTAVVSDSEQNNKTSSKIDIGIPGSATKDTPISRFKGKRKSEMSQPIPANIKQPKISLPQSNTTGSQSNETVSTKEAEPVVNSPHTSKAARSSPITVLGEDGKHFVIKVERECEELQENSDGVDNGSDRILGDSTFNDDDGDNFYDDGDDDINDDSMNLDSSWKQGFSQGDTDLNSDSQSSAGGSKGKMNRPYSLVHVNFGSGQRTFKKVSSEDIEHFVDSNQQNKNTLRKTTGDMILFKTFCETKDEFRTLETIPPYQLNQLLCEFILSVTKKNGTEYEPTSLRGMIGSIHRYLRSNEYNWSIITSSEFQRAREVLKTKLKQLKMLGKGNSCKTKAADQIDDELIEKFYECGLLGDRNPKALINSLWMICTIHFGIRTGQEAYNLKWGDVQLNEDSLGEYLLCNAEKLGKAKIDSSSRLCRSQSNVKIDQNRDPIHLYKLYSEKRPVGMLEQDSPFFLSVANSSPNNVQPWYKNQSMGINKLYNILRDMKMEADNQTVQRSSTSGSKAEDTKETLNI